MYHELHGKYILCMDPLEQKFKGAREVPNSRWAGVGTTAVAHKFSEQAYAKFKLTIL